MRHILVTLLFSIHIISVFSVNQLDSLLKVLDHNIRNSDKFIDIKENEINNIKSELQKNNLSAQIIYSINKRLAKEYYSYLSDSTIFYLNENLALALSTQDKNKVNETCLELASINTALGLYKESDDIMNMVKKEELSENQIIDYYLRYKYLYGGLSFYTQDKRNRYIYTKKYDLYQDTILLLMDPDKEEYLRIKETRFRTEGNMEDALATNNRRLELVGQNDIKYALVAFHRSLIYFQTGDTTLQKKWLILSSLSDIQLANRDNAALSNLANIFYEEGDIDRAYSYIRFSLDNAILYNTRLRRSAIMDTQDIIDKTYQSRNRAQTKKLSINLAVISILSLLLVFALIYIYLQMKRLSRNGQNLKDVNIKLNSLHENQKMLNEQLSSINTELSEANHIKEEYIGYFLNRCAVYIDKLDDYRKMVNKKLASGQNDELLKLTKGNKLKETESGELFSTFDKMFLNLYPDFVSELNSLLLDEEPLIPKKGELLNTELRIFALIKLGIKDSSKIARFLDYSVNTIYNYRAKVKSKAKYSREDFEDRVKNIGTFSK